MNLVVTLGVILVAMIANGIFIYILEKSTKETEKMIDLILANYGAKMDGDGDE